MPIEDIARSITIMEYAAVAARQVFPRRSQSDTRAVYERLLVRELGRRSKARK